MITTTLYLGQGLGNQLWSWAVLTSIALNNGYDWGIQAPWRFKGKGFMNLDMGNRVIGIPSKGPSNAKILGIKENYYERKLIHDDEGYDISEFDPYLMSTQDNVKLNGNFQSELYISNHKERITTTFQIKTARVELSNTCIIHFRGGDYAAHDSLLLPPSYYRNAMLLLLRKHPKMRFLIITNHTKLAKYYFPGEEIVSNYLESEVYSGPDSKVDDRVAFDFSLLQNAPFLIISNSSFSWWGAWTNRNAIAVIAPKYWARHNANNGYWSTGGIITSGWSYLDRQGHLWSSEECAEEFRQFKKSNEYKVKRVV